MIFVARKKSYLSLNAITKNNILPKKFQWMAFTSSIWHQKAWDWTTYIGRSLRSSSSNTILIPNRRSRILTFFHEGFLWLQQLFRAATIDLDLMRKIIDFYQVKDEVFQGNFFIFPLSSSSYHLTFKSCCCCCLSVDKVVSVLKKNDAQWAKMWKKIPISNVCLGDWTITSKTKINIFWNFFITPDPLCFRDPPLEIVLKNVESFEANNAQSCQNGLFSVF